MSGPRLAERIKVPLKALRASQPFNSVATVAVRGCLRWMGWHSEWVIRHLHRMGTVTAALPNGRTLRLWSRGDDWVSNQVFWRGWAGYEPETAPVFFELARRARITLDVGAYVGYYTLLAAHANPAGRVLAFEPLPTAHERLLRHVELNGLSNVECLAAAVAAAGGETDLLHVPGELPTSSSLSFEFMKGAGDLVRLRVPVLALDQFLRERGLAGVDLVKVDTESTEAEVLSGLADTLRRDRPWIVSEVLKGRGAEEPLAALLGPLGYRYYLLTPEGPVERTALEGHPTWLNYLFVARGREVPGRGVA